MRRVYIKRIYYILLIISIYPPTLFAASLSSSNYTLSIPSITTTGGSARSSNYLIKNVNIGEVFGGESRSASYMLKANKIDIEIPKTPTLNQVTTPTNIPVQTLSGTKEADTSIYINGYEAVSLDSNTTWSYNFTLIEGDNHLIITARKASGQESDPLYVSITLDTIPPFIIINNPLDATIVYENPITVTGTIDGVLFNENRNLNLGLNTVTVERSDGAGNTSFRNIEVYLIREPLAPPQTQ